jgi:hypothetical protein
MDEIVRELASGSEPTPLWRRDPGLNLLRGYAKTPSFGAAGITSFLQNGGSLEVAQRIAGHADSRTTKLYDRRAQQVLVEDMERIRY